MEEFKDGIIWNILKADLRLIKSRQDKRVTISMRQSEEKEIKHYLQVCPN